MKLMLLMSLFLAIVQRGDSQDCKGAAFDAQKLRFAGVGYDLIKGNPDGQTSGFSQGGTDPGILATRKILKVTDGSVTKVPRDSCVEAENIYENSQKYQKKLENEISVAGDASYLGYSFSASAGFKSAQQQTTDSHSLIYEKNKLCFKGTVRYNMGLAATSGFTITDSFASAVCRLPTVFNAANKNAYMTFLATWGTHVITELDLGIKEITRKKTSSSSVLEYAESHYSASVSFSGSGAVASGSLSVDVSGYKNEESFKSLFSSSSTTYNIGSAELPEPIRLKLTWIGDVLDPMFWSNVQDLISRGICSAGFNVEIIQGQLKLACDKYPEWLDVQKANDLPVNIPLRWPKGTYGLIMPKLACSSRDSGATQTLACPTGIWYTGWRQQETEDKDNDNYITPNSCINAFVNHDVVTLNFCMKHTATGAFRMDWPKGSYCIMKKQDCPKGFTAGFDKWDDEDYDNDNDKSGHLPDGVYNHDTRYEFCCRNDELSTQAMYLPTEKPFYLFPVTEHCQEVHGMEATKEIIYWDDEDDCCSNNARSPMHPYDFGSDTNHKLLFCYYKPK